MRYASCWRRRGDADPNAFRDAVAAICACHLQHAEVRHSRAYWQDENVVTIETDADTCYLTAPPRVDVARLIYALASLGEANGSFRW